METSDLIVTKLNTPISNRYTVKRKHLLDKLQYATKDGTNLVLLLAPAGFGKTTLLSQWAEDQKYLGWYSLDQRDSDACRFLKYLIATLDKIGVINGEETLAHLDDHASHGYENVIRIIINSITEFSEQLCIVLDNFHTISGDQVIEIILELLRFAPKNLQLVIASQKKINLGVGGMTMPGMCLEITKEDLRFNLQEIQDLINGQMSVSINDSLTQELLDKTEGWAAILQLALAARSTQKPLADFIQSFSCTTPEIKQYLATVFFDKLDQDSKHFLLTTSILDRFNTKVSSLVSGIQSTQNIINRLEETGLFIIALDSDRDWYRIQDIFREFLRAQLLKKDSSQLNIIYQQAYEWFLAEDLHEEAISYALETDNIPDAIPLIDELALELIKAGDFLKLQGWIEKIPKQYYPTQPSLLLYNCWALAHMGLCQQAEYWLDELHQLIVVGEKNAGAKTEWEKYKIGHKTLSLANAVTSDKLHKARKLIPINIPNDLENAIYAGTAYNCNAAVSLVDNNFKLARRNIDHARRSHQLCKCSIGLVYTYCIEALLEYEQGRLYACQLAVDHVETMMKEWGVSSESSTLALIKIPKAAILYSWNQLNGASDLLTRYLPLIEKCSFIEVRNMAFITLARISHQQGETDAALRLLDRSLEVISECSLERSKILMCCERMKILLTSNRLNEMHKQMHSIGMKPSQFPKLPKVWDRLECLKIFVWCLYKVTVDPHANLIPVIEHMQNLALKYERYYHMLDIMLLHVRLLCALQQSEQAQVILENSFDWAESEDYLRLYLDQGAEIEALLRSLLKQPDMPIQREKFIRRILATFDVLEQEKYKRQSHIISPRYEQNLRPVRPVDELSKRERAILELINEGMQNKSIAFQLSITTNTVRWHVSNILGKLNVKNRTQALIVARNLNLLDI